MAVEADARMMYRTDIRNQNYRVCYFGRDLVGLCLLEFTVYCESFIADCTVYRDSNCSLLKDSFPLPGVQAGRDPCSDLYQGSNPFSEPESRALRKAVSAVKRRTKVREPSVNPKRYWSCMEMYRYFTRPCLPLFTVGVYIASLLWANIPVSLELLQSRQQLQIQRPGEWSS